MKELKELRKYALANGANNHSGNLKVTLAVCIQYQLWARAKVRVYNNNLTISASHSYICTQRI